MSADASTPGAEGAPQAEGAAANARRNGAVIAGVIPGQSPRVLKKAAHFAKLMNAPLVVVHVDVTRFVTYEDPDGYVHSAPIDLTIDPAAGDLDVVRSSATAVLENSGLEWSVEQLVGDPALAIKHFADRIDARLIVVGTRKRGLGESIREFFTGAVAARLAHRQHRSILVVPLGEPVPDDQEIWTE